MLHLIGQPAFSAFRIEKLLRSLRAEVPAVTGLSSEYRYFAEVDGDGVFVVHRTCFSSGKTLLTLATRYSP